MGFLTGMFSAVVKTALTPVAIVKDTVNIATNEDVDSTTSLLENISEDVSNTVKSLDEGDLL